MAAFTSLKRPGQIGSFHAPVLRTGVARVVVETDSAAVFVAVRADCAGLGFGFCVVAGMVVFLQSWN